MRILITGATGFIGRRLLAMLGLRHEVVAITRHGVLPQSLEGVQWIQQDLTRPLDFKQFPRSVDAVIHLAQSKFYRNFPNEAVDIYDVNVTGTFRLLEYARQAGASHFIYASSGGIYGYSYEKFTENHPANPLNFYLSSKYCAELLIANYQRFFHTVVLRFFFVYGPGQRGMLIPTLMDKIRAGQPVQIEGNPGLKMNPIHVADAVRVFDAALELNHSDLFNVGGDEAITLTGLVKLIETVTGKLAIIEYTPCQRDGDLVGNNRRMKEVLGVAPTISLAQGLRDLL